jgi:hypothetical protein
MALQQERVWRTGVDPRRFVVPQHEDMASVRLMAARGDQAARLWLVSQVQAAFITYLKYSDAFPLYKKAGGQLRGDAFRNALAEDLAVLLAEVGVHRQIWYTKYTHAAHGPVAVCIPGFRARSRPLAFFFEIKVNLCTCVHHAY